MPSALDPTESHRSPSHDAERNQSSSARREKPKDWIAVVCALLVLRSTLLGLGYAATRTEAEVPIEGVTWPALIGALDWLAVSVSIVLTIATAKLVFRSPVATPWVTWLGVALVVAAGLDALQVVNFATLSLEVVPAFLELGLSAVLGCAYVAAVHGAVGHARESIVAWVLTGVVVLLDTPLAGALLRATGEVLTWVPVLWLRAPVHLAILTLLWRLRRSANPATESNTIVTA